MNYVAMLLVIVYWDCARVHINSCVNIVSIYLPTYYSFKLLKLKLFFNIMWYGRYDNQLVKNLNITNSIIFDYNDNSKYKIITPNKKRFYY